MKYLAIIGGGPRGLFALESLFLALYNANKSPTLKVTAFEPFTYPGSGWVWDPKQIESNWLNITERALQNLHGRPEMKFVDKVIPSFPSYTAWLPKEQRQPPPDVDDQFPPRAKIGAYLNERFLTIEQALVGFGWLTLIKEKVNELSYQVPKFSVITSENEYTNFDEIVLTVGHQDTELSDQLKEWKDHVTKIKTPILFTEPYPIEPILDTQITSENVVAFRGFGLAMIDQIRALTLQKGGRFETVNSNTKELKYISSQMHPQRFVPFSLDGLPMVPKPLNSVIDEQFKPSAESLKHFAEAIRKGANGNHPAEKYSFLMQAIANVVIPVYNALGAKSIPHLLSDEELYFLVINYLGNQSLEHELLISHDTPTLTLMERQVAMATGQAQISLDYCIGQVWRHCQPTIYKEFSYPKLPDEVIAHVIGLDEASKRYSYGPPVESMQQLIALAKVGILDLDFVKNPEIECVKSGWKLKINDKKATVDVMLNSVLDAPELVTINTAIIQNLLRDKIIEPLHTDLGIRTDDYGYVAVPEGKHFIPLAVMGRLSKGSVIGVDAILECFGERITSWAQRAINNIS